MKASARPKQACCYDTTCSQPYEGIPFAHKANSGLGDNIRTVLANEIANFRYFTRSYGVVGRFSWTLARSKGIFTGCLPMKQSNPWKNRNPTISLTEGACKVDIHESLWQNVCVTPWETCMQGYGGDKIFRNFIDKIGTHRLKFSFSMVCSKCSGWTILGLWLYRRTGRYDKALPAWQLPLLNLCKSPSCLYQPVLLVHHQDWASVHPSTFYKETA